MEATKQKQKLFGYDPGEDNEEGWNDFLHEIKKLLKAENEFYIEGRNMGWRHLSGHVLVTTNVPQEFMTAILPKTSELTIEVYKSDKPGALCDMTIWHHDAPVGEQRTIYTINQARKLKLYNGQD